MAFQVGQTVQGQGDWYNNPELQAIRAMRGQNVGQWTVSDPATGKRYIDTPWGRIEDRQSANFGNDQMNEAGNSAFSRDFSGQTGTGAFGRYANEHGSNAIQMSIDKDGNLVDLAENRESNADLNATLAAMATLGVGGALYGGAAAAAGGGGVAGAAPITAATPSALGGSVATATPVAQGTLQTAAGLGGAGSAAGTVAGGGTAVGAASQALGSGSNYNDVSMGNSPANAAAYEQMTGGPSGGGGYLDAAGRFISNNPGLVGAGVGALAGAASGKVDMTTTGTKSGSSSQNTNSGQNSTSQTGLVNYAQPAGRSFADMADRTAQGGYLGQGLGTNPYAGQNQFLNGAMDNVSRRMTDAYKDGTAAQTMGQFAAGGAFGGSAHQQFTESQNLAFGDSLGQTLGGMQMQDYTQQQGLAENQLNRNLNQFQGERQNMMNVGGGLANLGQTGSQSQNGFQNTNTNYNDKITQTQNGVGPWQGAIGGALAGWGMGQQAAAPQQNYLGGQQQTKAQPFQQPTAANQGPMMYAGGSRGFY